MINVLLINDSFVVQQFLKRLLGKDSDIQSVEIASDGYEGIEKTKLKDPDVILMDINMPNCNGVEATRQIMAKYPCPILIVTATVKAHMPEIYVCLNLGAIEVIKTPNMADEGSKLLSRIKIAYTLKSTISQKINVRPKIKDVKRLIPRPDGPIKGSVSRRIIAIGASTGGPNSVLKVLQDLPKDINASIIIVQHIDSSFAQGLAEWFDMNCSHLKIVGAATGDQLVKGSGFLACENKDLVVRPNYLVGYDMPVKDPVYSPCIDVTFQSISRIYGSDAIGVLLTGMGDDGARGLKIMKEAGARTIAQDEKTSIIYGMPKAAKDLGAAEFILPLDDIGSKITSLL